MIDADSVAHDVLRPGGQATEAVVTRFGPSVRGADGGIDRAALGAIVFADSSARRDLEALTHPAIRAEMARRAASSKAPVVVMEAALLVETGGRASMAAYGIDVLVVVAAEPAQQVARALERGTPRERVEAVMAAQATASERMAAADYVLDNRGTIEELEAGVATLWAALAGRARPATLADPGVTPRLRGILFDVGDTLIAPHPSFLELFALVMREQGHEVTPGEVEEALQTVGRSVSEVIGSEGSGDEPWSTSEEKSRRFWRRLYGAMLAHWGIPDADGAIFGALYSRFTRPDSYRLFPDVLPALEACREAGLVLGIVSNFEAWLDDMLAGLGVSSFFATVVISGKEGIEKPDPEIFRRALERSGLAPGETAFVGDHPRLDIAAARGLGMTGVLIDRWDRYPDADSLRIRTLAELLPALGL